MLPALVALALAALTVALLGISPAGRAAAVHLLLAAGALPLILGAMSHFIPVLTRTRAAPRGFVVVPLLALAGGAAVVGALASHPTSWAPHGEAVLAVAAAATTLAWSRRRRAGMLGQPHPCLGWYEAALVCLLAALLAILASALWPQQTIALRRFHLHLNTLGFVGLTALSTLAVLLPTVAGKPDPHVAVRLRRDLPWALGGTLLVATGAAWATPLAWIGVALWAVAPARLGASWLQSYRSEILAWHGAAPLLAAALAGLAVSVVIGAVNALPGAAFAPTEPVLAFVGGFMPPLIAGAASQLLPVWLRPGVQREWHATLRAALGRYGGVRALWFGVAGVAAGCGQAWGLQLAAAVLIWFLLQAGAALMRVRPLHERHPT